MCHTLKDKNKLGFAFKQHHKTHWLYLW